MDLSGDDGLFWVCNIVWCLCFTGDVSTGWTRSPGCLFYLVFGAFFVACTGVLLSFFMKMAANVVSAVIVLSLIVEKFTSGQGGFKLSVMS